MSAAPRSGMRGTTWFILCLCLLAPPLLVGCSQRADLEQDTASPQQLEENDDPLDPPVLEFEVGPSGKVRASPERRAEAGESVGVVLDNDGERDHRLRLVDPDGAEVFATTAPAGERAQGNALPRTPGRYTVAVHAVGDPRNATRFDVQVSEN